MMWSIVSCPWSQIYHSSLASRPRLALLSPVQCLRFSATQRKILTRWGAQVFQINLCPGIAMEPVCSMLYADLAV
jgi:hypothetical protein